MSLESYWPAAGRVQELASNLMRRTATTLLGLGSVPIGVGIGVWTALLMSLTSCGCPSGASVCNCGLVTSDSTFATWQCALFGAGAAVVVLLLALAVWRLPSTRRFKVA
jgi:ABC-type microcin C transport system permease subunit YejB